jgi:hypothetical protein
MQIKEDLLQFIWEKKYFDTTSLKTVCGKTVIIKCQGTRNLDQGPDFLNARILIDQTEWAGTIELHTTTREWGRHGHHNDLNYKNVILHVVWKNDQDLFLQSPVLELYNIVDPQLIDKYLTLSQKHLVIPCSSFGLLPEYFIEEKKWVSELLLNRVFRKSDEIISELKLNQGNWDALIWTILCKNFGYRVNSSSFYYLSKSIPFQLLKKYRDNIFILEALLMGQAGMLHQNWKDEYPRDLLRIYLRFKKLYGLKEILHPIYFLRMRPANFPTIRLAQLAGLLHHKDRLLDIFKNADNFKDVEFLFSYKLSEYWVNHYRFDKSSPPSEKKPGKSFIQNLIINSFVPILYAYGRTMGSVKYKETALGWLRELNPESNSIISEFESHNVFPFDASESQGLLELHKYYCDNAKCIDCRIGNKILSSPNNSSTGLMPIVINS